MQIMNALRLYKCFSSEWERAKGKDWFQRLDETSFDLEKSRLKRLLKLCLQFSLNQKQIESTLIMKRVKFDKWREMVELPLNEQLIHGVLRQILAPSVEQKISPFVHSFIRGRSIKTAFDQIRKQLAHYRNRTSLRERALFVFRADIRKCGESIPVHPRSKLWALIRESLPPESPIPHQQLMDAIQRAVRPVVQWKDHGGEFQFLRGIPTGSPIQPLLLNLYLGQMDDYFESFSNSNSHSIYCRYGDDFFFAHPDEAVFNEVIRGLPGLLRNLELEILPEKQKTFRWSGSGFKGKSSVEFLGFELNFNGTIKLNRMKENQVARHLRYVVRKTFYVLKNEPMDRRIQMARKMIEMALGIDSMKRHPYIDKLLSIADDRNQLKALDHELSSAVSREITGLRRLATFRQVSKKSIYQEYQIPSLVRERNCPWNR